MAFWQGVRCSSDSTIDVISSSKSALTHSSALSQIAVRSYPPSNDRITYVTCVKQHLFNYTIILNG